MFLISLLGLEPALRKDVPNRTGNGFKLVARRDFCEGYYLVEGEVAFVKGFVRAGEFHRSDIEAGEQSFLSHKNVLL